MSEEERPAARTTKVVGDPLEIREGGENPPPPTDQVKPPPPPAPPPVSEKD